MPVVCRTLLASLCLGAAACASFHQDTAPGTDASLITLPHDSGSKDARDATTGARDAGSGDAGSGDAGDARAEGGDLLVTIHDNPDAGALRSVWGASTDDVYAVGDNGAAFEWSGGKVTTSVLGSGANMYGVWGSGAEDVYAVGALANQDVALIMQRVPVGWIEVTASYPHAMRAVWGTGTQTYAVGYDGVVLSGDNFSQGTQIDPNADIPLTTYAPILYSVSGTSADNIMVAADVDTTAYYDGTIWHVYADPTDRTRTYRSVFGAPDAGADFYWGANYYGLWHFTGKTNPVLQLNEERNAPQDFSLYIWSIWGLNSDRIVCVGDGGRIMTYDKTTDVVRIHASPTGRNLYGVWGTSFDDIWIVGDGQLVLHGSIGF